MQFKHPELLYALFLLVIPIIVHLFQLRKFQKEEFTNVKFLQRVILQTRKSSQLKKWLTLLARLLALACLVLAFAQPFLTTSENATKPQETVIYLDNSFSMQAKGAKGELLKRAIQELLETLPEDQEFTLLTNTERIKNTSLKDSRTELQQLDYVAQDISIETALLRAKNEFTSNTGSIKNFIAISDFQLKDEAFITEAKDINTNLIQLAPVNTDNLSVDSVYVSERGINSLTLTTEISSSGNLSGTFPVSLYNGNNLIAKTSVEMPEDGSATTTFSIQNPDSMNGSIVVEDTGLHYDNALYFSLNKPEPIKVVAISDANATYLNRLFASDEFELTATTTAQLDYNALNNANCVILNEVKKMPNGLGTILNQLSAKNGKVIIIPSQDADLNSYNATFNQLGLSSFGSLATQERQVTQIIFAHPVYEGVFDRRIDNFQYPKVQAYFPTTARGNTVLAFADNTAFLEQSGNIYRFTAPINSENSNFKKAPLIVPTFYNIAKQSLQAGQLYHTNTRRNVIDVNVNLSQDNILNIENADGSFIPLQQNFNNKVQITTDDLPAKADNYEIKDDDVVVQNISFNYDRSESGLTYQNVAQLDNVTTNNQVSAFFEKFQEDNSINDLWKWFVIFALLFLIVELLLLKYLK